jgi:hypothetical protein
MKRWTKLKVKNAAPPAKIAIQQSETTPPNMSKKKPHAIAAAKVFLERLLKMS